MSFIDGLRRSGAKILLVACTGRRHDWLLIDLLREKQHCEAIFKIYIHTSSLSESVPKGIPNGDERSIYCRPLTMQKRKWILFEREPAFSHLPALHFYLVCDGISVNSLFLPFTHIHTSHTHRPKWFQNTHTMWYPKMKFKNLKCFLKKKHVDVTSIQSKHNKLTLC